MGLVLSLSVLVAGCSAQSGENATSSVSSSVSATDSQLTDTRPEPVKPRVVDHGPRDRNEVALTFDADMTATALKQVHEGKIPRQVNEPLLAYLRETKTPSTVFVTGLWAKEYPDEVRKLGQDSTVTVANHTWDHLAWTADCYGLPSVTGEQAKVAQVRKTSDLLHGLTGKYPRYFRFPGLCHKPADVKIVASQGETPVDWDVNASDAFAKNGGVIAAALAKQAQPGSILVFHLNGAPNAPETLEIVKSLVPALKKKGLEPVNLDQMLG